MESIISSLPTSTKPLFMGIVNVTPDSFSDGGKYLKLEDAIKHAEELIKAGVNIIDVGGESTKPGAKLISEEEELKRIIPVIYELRKLYSKITISVDTYKSNVAQLALSVGANMINDVSGLTMDSEMAQVAAKSNCPIVIMHNNGIPATKPMLKNLTVIPAKAGIQKVGSTRLDSHCHGNDTSQLILKEVYNWLKKQTDFALSNGIKKENIIVDPGIGFGKTAEEDFLLIQNLEEFKSLDFPILVGPSRKSFIKKFFEDCSIEEKTKEMIDIAIKNGANIVRLHKVYK